MNIAIIGYGKMGHEIEAIATGRGHVIKLIVDQDNREALNETNLKDIDVAIEFSSPGVALSNIISCLVNNVSVVSGTTGWLEEYETAVEICKKNNTSFIHSSNFSIGVNLFFRINIKLAEHMNRYRDYNVKIEDIHHIKKLDAPSGTAINLAGDIIEKHSDYNGWCFDDDKTKNCIPIHSVRAGEFPGTHIVTWDSDIDSIILKHEAKSRKGFALGAVVAAEYIYLRKGIFSMTDVMGF